MEGATRGRRRHRHGPRHPPLTQLPQRPSQQNLFDACIPVSRENANPRQQVFTRPMGSRDTADPNDPARRFGSKILCL